MNRGRSPEATALALSAVVAELRKGLRAHDIRARDVTSRTAQSGAAQSGAAQQGALAIDVSGMSLGDAAVLAVVLNEAAPSPEPSSGG